MEKKERLLRELENYSTIGKKIYFKDKSRKRYSIVGKVEDEVAVWDKKYGYKHFIQKIKYSEEMKMKMKIYKNAKYGFRFGYYTHDAKFRRIVWGQYASHMPEDMFRDLIGQAKHKFLDK